MMKLILHLIFAMTFVVSAISASDVAPQESKPRDSVSTTGVSFNVSALKTDLTTDDTLIVILKVTIRGNESDIDIAEIPNLAINGFDLISTGSSSMRSLNNDLPALTKTTTYYFRPTAAGSYSIPTLTLDYVDTRTGAITTLGSASIPLIVSAEGSGQVSVESMLLLIVIIIMVVTIATVVFARMKRGRAARKVDDTITSPEEELKTALDLVEVKLAHGRIADGQTTLTEAVEQYIESKYSIRLSGLERESCYEAMNDVGVSKALMDKYLRLVEWMQGLRFGGMPASEPEIEAILASLRQVVEHH